MSLTLEQHNPVKETYSLWIHVLFFLSCILSVSASFSTFIIYYKYRHLSKNYPARLIILVCLSDGLLWGEFTLNLASRFFSNQSFQEESATYCQFSAIFRCFWVLFNLCCIFLIGFSLFCEIVLTKRAENFEKCGYLISAVLSMVLAFIPYWQDNYGNLDAYQCWILDAHLNLAVFYTPVCFVVVCDFIFIFSVIKFLRKLQGHFGSRNILLKFLSFPIILIVAWVPGFIRMLGQYDSVELDAFMYILMPLQGILNPFIYGSIFTIVKKEVFGKKENERKTPCESTNKVVFSEDESTGKMTYEDLMAIKQELSETTPLLLKTNTDANLEIQNSMGKP